MKQIIKVSKMLLAFVALYPGLSNAELLSCGARTINNLYVQGDRDDNHEHANKLIIRISEQCNGNDLVYIENTNPAYSSFHSTLLTAYTTSQQVNIFVNTSKTIPNGSQISLLQLVK